MKCICDPEKNEVQLLQIRCRRTDAGLKMACNVQNFSDEPEDYPIP